jgi:hypothetical protein
VVRDLKRDDGGTVTLRFHTSGKCECTEIRGNVTKDGPVNLWAKFPAPPATVQKITVVVSGFEPIESVPLTER